MTAQNIGNLAWAYASLYIPDTALFKSISADLMRRDFNAFHGQHFSQISWAYATLHIQDPELFEKLSRHWMTKDCLRNFTQMQLATVHWSFGTMKVGHTAMMDRLIIEVLRRQVFAYTFFIMFVCACWQLILTLHPCKHA